MPALPAQNLALAAPPRRGRLRAYLADHPVAMDWIVVAAATLLTLPLFAEFAIQGHWVRFALLAVQQLALRARRRSPWAVLVVTVAIDAALLYQSPNSSVMSGAMFFALYSVAVAAPALVAFGAALLASVPASVYYAFVYTPHGPEISANARYVGLVAAVSVLLMDVIAAGLGAWVRGSREHQAEVRAWAMRRAELASVQERNRIAREMHDVVAHSLTVMVTLSDGAAKVAPKDVERAQEVLGELSRTGRTALADMRRVLGVLRENPGTSLAPTPGMESLHALVAGFRTAGLPAVLTLTGAPPPPDPAFQLAIYRIVQESLTNALRYGRSVGRVDVTVEREGSRVRIRVENDGGAHDGAEPRLGTGGGLAGMRERAALYGGKLHAGPRPGGGWVVETELHWIEGDR
ncbi:sensor histidine kinase [Sinomonas sp. ASV486]|uniref:sensor histidine kinase n=1 Tax=Sinomonas sp. ASV486 TaxID=3051170 RepID=UPI0027DD0D2E|nr:sensor histidine kinase [Sinomonas sp. ASV486]MDQ4491759.1 sensor histidine kinase [Sinomonas sp. ASV486]